MKNIIIRLEESVDYRTVEELTRTAFNTKDRVERSKINCPMEHYMVHRLREKDGIMDLSFVAENVLPSFRLFPNNRCLPQTGQLSMF